MHEKILGSFDALILFVSNFLFDNKGNISTCSQILCVALFATESRELIVSSYFEKDALLSSNVFLSLKKEIPK